MNFLSALHWLPVDKEHPCQPTFAERHIEDAEGTIRDEHQQHDDKAGKRFLYGLYDNDRECLGVDERLVPGRSFTRSGGKPHGS